MAASALAFKPVVKAAWRAPVRRSGLLLDVLAQTVMGAPGGTFTTSCPRR